MVKETLQEGLSAIHAKLKHTGTGEPTPLIYFTQEHALHRECQAAARIGWISYFSIQYDCNTVLVRLPSQDTTMEKNVPVALFTGILYIKILEYTTRWGPFKKDITPSYVYKTVMACTSCTQDDHNRGEKYYLNCLQLLYLSNQLLLQSWITAKSSIALHGYNYRLLLEGHTVYSHCKRSIVAKYDCSIRPAGGTL